MGDWSSSGTVTRWCSRKPDVEGRGWTAAQAVHRERFRQAALYGKVVMADPETKVVYEEAAKAQGQPVFSLTVADFFHAPAVDEVDLSGYAGQVGDAIVVRVSDDVDVGGPPVRWMVRGFRQVQPSCEVVALQLARVRGWLRETVGS